MYNMSYAGTRRKHQRKINKVVRDLNTGIERDDYWKGRFRMNQLESRMIRFDDHSGFYLLVLLECYDKKTKKSNLYIIEESQFFISKVWRAMNHFITEYLHTSAGKEGKSEYLDTRHVSSGRKIEDFFEKGDYSYGG